MFLFDNNEIVRRLRKYPILKHFSEFELRKLVAQSETLALEANEVLFYYDDPSESVFYLIEGHLEGFTSDDFSQKIIEIHQGEMIGEMGVISGEPHSITVRAVVASQVLKIEKDIFLNFFEKDPKLLAILTQMIAKRLRHVITDLRYTHYPYKNIAFVLLSRDFPIEDMKALFRQYIDVDNVCLYEKQNYEASNMDVISFFYSCGEHTGINIFIADCHDENWFNAVLGHAEYIYLVTKEREWNLLEQERVALLRGRPTDIVILHQKPWPYENTSKFYAKYPFKRHHHILANKESYQRLYRYMTGQAIGLVLSGGGLRGYVHYGLIKALLEAKVPIDCIAGTSMGAAMGGFLAMNPDWNFFDTVFNTVMDSFKKTRVIHHLTIPVVSLLSGQVITQILEKYFVSFIEDLPINFFCVVGNLSNIQKEIKMRGLLSEWVRASVAIPGILPPVSKEGEIYVDGSVCTNLPVQDMRDYLDHAGKIIAFNVHLHPFQRKNYHFPSVLTFKDLIKWKLGLVKQPYVFPHFVDIVTESYFISQYMQNTKEVAKADILISPDTSMFNIYDAKKGGKLHMFAYELAQEKLKEYKTIYQRWL